MPQTELSKEEIQKRAEEWYENNLRPIVETGDNVGKIIMIDIESGDYEIDPVSLTAAHRMKAKHPDAVLYAMRIGYDAVYSFGGAPHKPSGQKEAEMLPCDRDRLLATLASSPPLSDEDVARINQAVRDARETSREDL
jgi:hypothetical protein